MTERELTQELYVGLAIDLAAEFHSAVNDFAEKHPEATIAVGIAAGRMYLFDMLRTARKKEVALYMLAESYERIKEAIEQAPDSLFGTGAGARNG